MKPTEEDKLLALQAQGQDVDDAAHIEAARDGDPQAQSWLVQRWQGPLYRYALRIMGSEEDAHDAVQDTLVKMLRKIDQYDDQYAFSTWVFGICRNTCIDTFRRRKKRSWEEPGEVVDTAPSPMSRVSKSQEAKLLEQALQQLSPMYREVLLLYHFEHLKYREIADTLEIPMGTVMNRIFRARKKLRTAYEDLGGTA